MGLFSGLEKLGFKNTEMEVFNKEENKKVRVEEKKKQVMEPLKEEDCLFPKSYTCPICDEKFKCLTVKTGKIRSVSQDDDLRPVYREMEPLKYDAVICPHCGYAALAKYFPVMLTVQSKRIREKVIPQFQGIEISENKYSYEEALLRYKMVLLCDVVGGVQSGRKAYTCLKMAWLIRSKMMNEGENLNPEERRELEKDELECIQNAYEGYCMAFSSETFPISGMDEITLSYLCAELAYRLGKYSESLRLLSNIIANNHVPQRIKDKALVLKDRIRLKNDEEKHENND